MSKKTVKAITAMALDDNKKYILFVPKTEFHGLTDHVKELPKNIVCAVATDGGFVLDAEAAKKFIEESVQT